MSVHDISIPFLYFVETFLARNSFVQPFFATDDTIVVSVEPETERKRKGDSCASAFNVTASVDVSPSGQGNEASELNGDRRECVFCFCSPCVNLCYAAVVGPWAGCSQEKFRKKLYRKCWSMKNMRGARRPPLDVRKKETAMCRDTLMELLCMCLERSCRSVS